MRLGFAARYVPTAVRVYPGTEAIEEYGGKVRLDRYGAVLVAGHDDYGHNRLAGQTTRGYRFGPR
jgi:non-heme Fe2+,alpha-ketoglutarate-dependent halogenase